MILVTVHSRKGTQKHGVLLVEPKVASYKFSAHVIHSLCAVSVMRKARRLSSSLSLKDRFNGSAHFTNALDWLFGISPQISLVCACPRE